MRIPTLSGHHRIAILALFIFLVPVAWVTAAKAAPPNLNQPICVSWDSKYPLPAFYEPGQKLSYGIIITNCSKQQHYVFVQAQDIVSPSKDLGVTTHHLTYNMAPGQTLHVFYQTFAPTDAVFTNGSISTIFFVNAEGYGTIHLGNDAWQDSGK